MTPIIAATRCEQSSGSLIDRTANWLHSDYDDAVWIVSDTFDRTRTYTIDFRVVLATGACLTETSRLYSTVKAYAFLVRDSRYSRIDDAQTHGTMVANLCYWAHALSLRGIPSFSLLQPYDIECIVEDCRFGAMSVVHALERIAQFFKDYATRHAGSSERFAGLPETLNATTGWRQGLIDSPAILRACNIPEKLKINPHVARAIKREGKRFGFRFNEKGPVDLGKEAPSNITVQALQRWLDPIEHLYAMRRAFGRAGVDAIEFKPFPQGAAKVAVFKGGGTQRTPIPPPMLVLDLLERTTRWLFASSTASIVNTVTRSAALRLATACWIIIATFSARRDEEIDDLRLGCLRGDASTGWWLHVYIEKTLQRKEWIPVPALVVRAVELLEVLSSKARAETQTDHLFQWMDADGDVSRLDVGRHLDSFAEDVGLPAHTARDGTVAPWHWHPHQFRRFFAVLYFYRFEGAAIEALSHHLRHFDLETTRGYTRDTDLMAIWSDVRWGYTRHYAGTVVRGERSMSGSAGNWLKRAANRILLTLQRKVQIVDPEKAGAVLATIMHRKGMVLTPKPWVTCSCPTTADAAKKAACRRSVEVVRGAKGPDFARAAPSVCGQCPHAIGERERASFIESEAEPLKIAMDSGLRDGTPFGILERERVVELTRFSSVCADAAPIDVPARTEQAK